MSAPRRAFLETVPLFAGVLAETLDRLASISTEIDLEPDEILFRQQEPCEAFFIVRSGRVRVFVLSPSGRSRTLRVFIEREPFALVPILDGGPYPASAAAEGGPASVVSLDRRAIRALSEKDTALARRLAAAVANRARHLSVEVENQSLRGVIGRLARFLLASQAGSARGYRVQLDVTREALAARLGTSREVVSRSLRRLARLRLVKVAGRAIDVLDADGLRDLADG